MFNHYGDLENVCYKIIEHLMLNNDRLWKLLKYNSNDALLKDNLTLQDKRKLIFTGNSVAKDFRVFLQPYLDDSFLEECAMIRIYPMSIYPDNHLMGTVYIAIETISHVKVVNIMSDDEMAPVKSRETVMLSEIMKTLNGKEVNGVGVLQFNREHGLQDKTLINIWNNRNFFGHTTVMSVKIAGGTSSC
jgi:hypothetical protein